MRIVTNESLIKRNARIGQIASISGLIVLVGGMIVSFQKPEFASLSVIALLVGFLLSQVGIYFGNRFARPPRLDQALNQALKGLDKRHSLYHYSAPVSHLLVGPSGIWALFPRYQRGTITYKKDRWHQKGGISLAYLKFFAQEGLGRPDLEIGAELDRLKKFFQKELPEVDLPPIQAVLAFVHPDAKVQADGAPVPTLPIQKLKDFIRKNAKQNRLSEEKLALVRRALDGEDTGAEDE